MQARLIIKVPRTLMSYIKSKRFGSVSSVVDRLIAEALFIKISIPPNFSIVLSTTFCTWSSNRISHCTANALPPACSISCAAEKIVPPSLGFSSTLFDAITILAPAFANFSPIALPIPRLAPVIMTVLFLNSMAISFKSN